MLNVFDKWNMAHYIISAHACIQITSTEVIMSSASMRILFLFPLMGNKDKTTYIVVQNFYIFTRFLNTRNSPMSPIMEKPPQTPFSTFPETFPTKSLSSQRRTCLVIYYGDSVKLVSFFAVNVANLSKKKENWHKFYSSCRLCSWFSVLFIKFSEKRQSQNQRRICVIKEIPRNCIKIMTWKGLLFQSSKYHSRPGIFICF